MKQFPLQPTDEDGLVFNEPWEAQAFGLVLALYEQGLFNWQEWAEQLSGEIKLAQENGDPDLGNTYYQHWMRALEKIAGAKGLTNLEEVDVRSDQWREAYLNTPHGKPIKLHAQKPSP